MNIKFETDCRRHEIAIPFNYFPSSDTEKFFAMKDGKKVLYIARHCCYDGFNEVHDKINTVDLEEPQKNFVKLKVLISFFYNKDTIYEENFDKLIFTLLVFWDYIIENIPNKKRFAIDNNIDADLISKCLGMKGYASYCSIS